ncbi:MAG: ABC transporter-like protein [Chlorobi bacterium OLB7]|nr:MAG: ABC transporter-like protein [Chlorobi bacterium OLB7]
MGLAQLVQSWFGNVQGDPLTFGTLFAFIQFTEMFFRPVRDLSEKYNILQNAMASSERIFELLDTDSFAAEATGAEPFAIQHGAIEFKDVTFSYDGQHTVIEDLSFAAQPGQTVAIVGATGAGKTSVINILMRYYEHKSGTVLIDGRDLRTIPTADLRRDIALVMQDVFLFRGTILDNITLGDERITLEQAKKRRRRWGWRSSLNRCRKDTPPRCRSAVPP